MKEKTTAAARESVSEREEKTGEACKENRKKERNKSKGDIRRREKIISSYKSREREIELRERARKRGKVY